MPPLELSMVSPSPDSSMVSPDSRIPDSEYGVPGFFPRIQDTRRLARGILSRSRMQVRPPLRKPIIPLFPIRAIRSIRGLNSHRLGVFAHGRRLPFVGLQLTILALRG